MKLPPEDRPDTICIGPIRNMPIVADDDPRLTEARSAWSAATRTAQALHSTDELLWGLRHHDWRARATALQRCTVRSQHWRSPARVSGRTMTWRPLRVSCAYRDFTWAQRRKVSGETR